MVFETLPDQLTSRSEDEKIQKYI
jgi:hypothetical protein